MKNEKYTSQLKKCLYGKNRNPVEAAFLLQDWSRTYERYSGNPLTSSYLGLYDSFEKVGQVTWAMLQKLRKNQVPSLEELANLEKCFENLEKDQKTDKEMYGEQRSEKSNEYAEQRYRDAHTDRDGNWCPKGPDD